MTALTHDESPHRTFVRQGRVDGSPPPKAKIEGLRSTASHTLFTLSALIAWVLLYLLVLSGLEQAHAQRDLYQRLRTELALGTAPTGAPIPTGAPVALIDIPGAGVEDLVVVEGTRAAELKDAPGHFVGTVLPGQKGVSVVMGKGLSFGSPFGGLPELRRGALVRAVTAQGTFDYRVTGSRRAGDLAPPPPAEGTSRLTLVTAAGSGTLGALRPGETFYVDATLETGAVDAGRMGFRDPEGVPMKSRASAGLVAELVIALQLLALALAGVAWAWVRWSKVAAWLAGLPLVVAALWLASSLAAGLLPGLI